MISNYTLWEVHCKQPSHLSHCLRTMIMRQCDQSHQAKWNRSYHGPEFCPLTFQKKIKVLRGRSKRNCNKYLLFTLRNISTTRPSLVTNILRNPSPLSEHCQEDPEMHCAKTNSTCTHTCIQALQGVEKYIQACLSWPFKSMPSFKWQAMYHKTYPRRHES